MECSIHPPNSYICAHQSQLLPDWEQPVVSVLIVLQRCPVSLFDRTLETEVHKQQLRQRFLEFAGAVAARLRQQNYSVAIFDPRTGEPIDSAVGSLPLHDVAVVRSLLGYATTDCGGCLAIVHPHWQGGVYPATVLSSAPPAAVETAMQQVLDRHPVVFSER